MPKTKEPTHRKCELYKAMYGDRQFRKVADDWIAIDATDTMISDMLRKHSCQRISLLDETK